MAQLISYSGDSGPVWTQVEFCCADLREFFQWQTQEDNPLRGVVVIERDAIYALSYGVTISTYDLDHTGEIMGIGVVAQGAVMDEFGSFTTRVIDEDIRGTTTYDGGEMLSSDRAVVPLQAGEKLQMFALETSGIPLPIDSAWIELVPVYRYIEPVTSVLEPEEGPL